MITMKILILHVNGLHLGYLGCYGNDWVQTPNLDRLAAESVVFDQHIAECPRMSRRTCWSGRYDFPSPEGKGAPDETSQMLAPLEAQGVQQLVLDGQGQSAKAISASLCKRLERWGKSVHGLLLLDWPALAPPWNVPDEFLDPYFLADEAEEEAMAPWLDPPAGPFNQEGADLERLQNTYAAAVTAFDAQVGTILKTLTERGLLDETWFVLTGDCGLPLGEHGYIGEHRAWLHDELVHVPLILRRPGAQDAGLRIGGLTQPIDLFPTVLEVLELPPSASQGHSLLPLIRGEVEQVRPHALTGLALGYSVEWAIRTPGWALLLPLSTPPEDPPRAPQLFVKPEDRWEVNDVRQHHLELAEELERALRQAVGQ